MSVVGGALVWHGDEERQGPCNSGPLVDADQMGQPITSGCIPQASSASPDLHGESDSGSICSSLQPSYREDTKGAREAEASIATV